MTKIICGIILLAYISENVYVSELSKEGLEHLPACGAPGQVLSCCCRGNAVSGWSWPDWGMWSTQAQDPQSLSHPNLMDLLPYTREFQHLLSLCQMPPLEYQGHKYTFFAKLRFNSSYIIISLKYGFLLAVFFFFSYLTKYHEHFFFFIIIDIQRSNGSLWFAKSTWLVFCRCPSLHMHKGSFHLLWTDSSFP